MIKITDGTRTVNLQENKPGTFGLKRDGFGQGVARWNGTLNDYEDVTETVEVVWRETLDTQRADTLLQIGLLREKVENFARHNRPEDCVWLEAQTPTEGAIRYAIVKELWFDELDTRHYTAARLVGLKINLKREGAWRGVAPKSTPLTLEGGGVKTINMITDSTVVNWFDVQETVQGDAEPLWRIRLKQLEAAGKPGTVTAMPNKFIIASRNKYTSFNPNFITHLATNLGGGTLIANAQAPNGFELSNTIAAGAGASVSWAWPTTPADYYGRYYAYLIGNIPTGWAIQAVLQSNFRTELQYVKNETSGSPTGNFVRPHYLGMITFPWGDDAGSPWYAEPSNPAGSEDVGIRIFNANPSGSATAKLWALLLVPADEFAFVEMPRVVANSGLNTSLVMDGIWRRMDFLNTDSTIYRSVSAPILRGDYITGRAGWINRIWVWGWRDGLLDQPIDSRVQIYYCDNEMEMTVQYVPRWLSLRPAVVV